MTVTNNRIVTKQQIIYPKPGETLSVAKGDKGSLIVSHWQEAAALCEHKWVDRGKAPRVGSMYITRYLKCEKCGKKSHLRSPAQGDARR